MIWQPITTFCKSFRLEFDNVRDFRNTFISLQWADRAILSQHMTIFPCHITLFWSVLGFMLGFFFPFFFSLIVFGWLVGLVCFSWGKTQRCVLEIDIHHKKKEVKERRCASSSWISERYYFSWLVERFCARRKRAYSSKEDIRSFFLFRLLAVQQPENLHDTRCWDLYFYSDSGNTAASSGLLVYQLNIMTISFPSGTPLFQWVLWFSW